MKFIADWTFTYPSQPVEGEGVFAPQGTPTKLVQVVVVHRVLPKSIGVWKIGWVIYSDLCDLRWTPGGLQVTFQVGIDLKIGGFSYEFAWN